MTPVLVNIGLFLAAATLGLRVTSVLIGPRWHSILRLIISIVIGTALVVATMQTSDSYQVHDLGLGLLISLAPVGIYDLAKWWFRRNQR